VCFNNDQKLSLSQVRRDCLHQQRYMYIYAANVFGELDSQISQQGKNAGSSFSPLIFRLFLVGGRLKIDPSEIWGIKKDSQKTFSTHNRIVSYLRLSLLTCFRL